MMAGGASVYRSANLTLAASTWTIVTWSAVMQSTENLWNGATCLTVARQGWHIMFATANLDTTANSANNSIRFLVDGSVVAQTNARKPADTANTPITIAAFRYMYVGQYLELQVLVGAAGSIDVASIPCVMGLLCLESA
jgi:hypothetical protein